MAIIQENYVLNGRQFVRTYSSANRYVVGGVPIAAYTEANDPAEFGRTYVEGNIIEEDGLTADEIVQAIEEVLA